MLLIKHFTLLNIEWLVVITTAVLLPSAATSTNQELSKAADFARENEHLYEEVTEESTLVSSY